MDHLTKLTELITQIGQISANLGFQADTTGKKFIEPDVKLELETAHIQLMQMYDELLHSRDDYQKAADAMAAEHKLERDKLHAELAVCEELQWQYHNDAIRNAKLAVKYREQLQKVTPKLPLTHYQIEQARREWLESPVNNDSAVHAAVKFAEKYHGIGGNT